MQGSSGIGIVGHGAVGSVIADSLAARAPRGTHLSGVYAHSEVPPEYRMDTFEALLDASDVIVEAAAQEAVGAYGPLTLESGRSLVVVSVGALRDDDLLGHLRELAAAGPGRLLVTTGAIGGVDILRAAAALGGLDRVELSTVKPPRAVVEAWMDQGTRDALLRGSEPVEVFRGTARDAVELFPTSVNVAATLSLTTIGFDRVLVSITGDPRTTVVTHTVNAAGSAGSYSFSFRNVPSPINVRTSTVTPFAVLRGLHDLTSDVVVGI